MNNDHKDSAIHQSAADSEELTLLARARALALPQVDAIDTETIEIVSFVLAYETYGIESVYIKEVHPLKDITPLPCTPPFVIGIISVHGQVVSVIDIKKFFELPAKGLSDLNKVIIISNGAMEFGILADAILDVRRVPLREIQPSLPTLTGIREDYLRGITTDRLVILDANRMLTDPKIIVRDEVV